MNILKIAFLFVIIAFFGCKEKKKTKIIEKQKVTKHVYLYDTTQYKRHKSGFLIDKKGDVFFSGSDIDFSSNEDTIFESYWIDNKIYFGEYPNKNELKDVIDIETFESLGEEGYYERDKNNVYYMYPTSDGPHRSIVQKANPKTIIALDYRWAKDAKHVFYRGDIVLKADISTFEVVKYEWAKDKNYVYYSGSIVEKADVKTFQLINERDSAMDKNYIYYQGEMVGKRK